MISIERVLRRDKIYKILEVLEKIDNEQHGEGTIIFVNDNSTAAFLTEVIREMVCPATYINGDSSGWQITEALQRFESREEPILIATSVGSSNFILFSFL